MKIHYSGGIVFENGNRLRGWPACCSGDQAIAIAEAGAQSDMERHVTCKKCLRMLQLQREFAPTYAKLMKARQK